MKEKSTKDQSIEEQSIKDQSIKEQNIKGQSIKEQGIKDQNTKDQSIGEQNTKDQNTQETMASAKPKKKKKILAGFIICALVAVILIFYGSVALYYQKHFFPGTTIDGIDCSNLEAYEVAAIVDSRIVYYKLEVAGRLDEDGESGIIGEINAQDIDLQFVDTLSEVEQLLKQQNALLWIGLLANKQYAYSLQQGVSFNEEMLSATVKEWDACQDMIQPKNAYISDYSEEMGGYAIIPETKGTQFDVEEVTELIKNAVLMQESSLNLEEQNCYKTASVTADDKTLNESVDTANKWLATEITYDWNGQEILLDKETIREWVSFDSNQPKLDEEAVAEFVAENARNCDTYGKSRKFMTTLGVELTLRSGAYGWKTDCDGETEELLQLIYQGSVLEKEPLYISKGRQKGTNDIGSSYVEADLTNQHLYLYYQGNLVLETDFVSGNMNYSDCITPSGVFGLTYKTRNAVLRGANYETPVSYWMPFHGNFGMHDATWRTEFGGDIYLTNGSHGCINLPPDKAEAIYGYVSTGFPVICYYY